MTARTAILDALRAGPRSRPEIERALIVVGYAPNSIPLALIQLKAAGHIQHVQRASRYRRSIYALKETTP